MTKRRSAFATARWGLVAVMTVSNLVTPGHRALAHPAQGVDEALTRFEQFQLEVCSPCVKESVAIATLQVAPAKLPGASRVAGARTSRAGEIAVDVLRSHLLGRPSRQMFAARLTLSVATGNPGEVYRIASGMVDEEEIAAFVSSLGEIVKAASTPTPSDAEAVEIDLHSGSIRVGAIRLKGETIVYVQAGDIRALERRAVWDAPTTLYLPLADLTTLRGALAQAAARIQKMRSGQ